MESVLSVVAAIASSLFAFDLWSDYRRRPRPHIAAYGTGMTMFAVATWALFIGVTFAWTGPVYRTFFLFGAVLNIPFLALGSMFLVVGNRSGHAMTVALGAFTAFATTLTLQLVCVCLDRNNTCLRCSKKLDCSRNCVDLPCTCSIYNPNRTVRIRVKRTCKACD